MVLKTLNSDKLKIYETLLNSKHSKQFPDKRFRDYENSISNQHRIEHKRALQTNNQFVTSVDSKGHKVPLYPNKERGKNVMDVKTWSCSGRMPQEFSKDYTDNQSQNHHAS
ncbi:hypothetical protein TNCV_4645311 [Trichonephila clavipes]|nr:hypothetical protein TNCV_4645311 [Trichonephila clavipes]